MSSTRVPVAVAISEEAQDTASAAFLLRWRQRMAAFGARHLAGTRGLAWAGSVSALGYLVLALAFPLTTWWFHTQDNLATIPLETRWGRYIASLTGAYPFNGWMLTLTLAYVVILFGSQALALYAVRTATDKRRAWRIVIGFALAFLAIQFWMQPVASTDLYGYLARSYLIAHQHQNPMVSLASILPGEYIVFARPPAPYGPLWLLICGLVGILADNSLLLAMMLMKLIVVVAAAATIFMVNWLAERIVPTQSLTVLVLFAWSPLLIIEAAGNGHNDVVMMAFVMGSLILLLRRRPLFAFPLLALGVVIKYAVGALIPLWAALLFMQYCWRTQRGEAEGPLPTFSLRVPRSRADVRALLDHIDRRRALTIFGGGGAISLALIAVCYAPFWAGVKTFTGLGKQLGVGNFTTSPTQIVYDIAQVLLPGVDPSLTGSAVRFLFYVLFAAYVIWKTLRLLQLGPNVTVADLITDSGKVLFAALLLITFWYQPWYIVWLVPLAALSTDLILRRHAMMLAFGGLLTYSVAFFGFGAQSARAHTSFTQLYLTLCAFGPMLVLRHSSGGSIFASVGHIYQRVSRRATRFPLTSERAVLVMILVVAVVLRVAMLGSVAWPLALAGAVTVVAVYLLAVLLCRTIVPERAPLIALLAALFVATSQWHILLSRADVPAVLAPLLWSVAMVLIGYARPRREGEGVALPSWVRLALLGGGIVCFAVSVAIAVRSVSGAMHTLNHQAPVLLWPLIPFAVLGALICLSRWYHHRGDTLQTLRYGVGAYFALLTGAVEFYLIASPVVGFAPLAIITALGLGEAIHWVAAAAQIASHAYDAIFLSRQHLVRVGLVLLVVIMSATTFIWYFATLTSGTPPPIAAPTL